MGFVRVSVFVDIYLCYHCMCSFSSMPLKAPTYVVGALDTYVW